MIQAPDGEELTEASPMQSLYFSRPYLNLILIAFVGLIVYSNTFSAPFVFDDARNISKNTVVHNLDNFTSSWVGYEHNPRRVVGYLSFTINYAVGGLDMRGYHIVNLIIHLLNGALVYLLVILTFRTPFFLRWGLKSPAEKGLHPLAGVTALLSALFFVAHPVQTQAVTCIVQRFTSLATLFYLLSVVLHGKGRLVASTDRTDDLSLRPLCSV